MPRAWRKRCRRWLVEPVIAGYAASGLVAIHALPELALQPDELPRVVQSLHAIALCLALALSFWRMFLGKLIRQLATTITDEAGNGPR